MNTTKGKEHDFSLFKKSRLPIEKGIQTHVDLGYLGIKKFHQNSEIPKKASKYHPLTNEDKKENQKKSSKRIFIEHINAKIKVFQMFAKKYRNRRKYYNLRMMLICGFINFDRGMAVVN